MSDKFNLKELVGKISEEFSITKKQAYDKLRGAMNPDPNEPLTPEEKLAEKLFVHTVGMVMEDVNKEDFYGLAKDCFDAADAFLTEMRDRRNDADD